MAPVTVASIVKKHSDAWASATSHPFLDAIANGTITPAQFNTWLVQDYHFVRAFVRFTAATLASAPEAHIDTLLGGAAALAAELAWFREKAAQRGLDLDLHTHEHGHAHEHDAQAGGTQKGGAALQPACREYREFLAELQWGPSGAHKVAGGGGSGSGAAVGGAAAAFGGGAPYAVKAAAFWAIEACYNNAWGSLRGRVPPEYAEFVERWGSPEFGAYVTQLAAQADAALAQEGPEVAAAAEGAVRRVAELEVRFWGMAFEGQQAA